MRLAITQLLYRTVATSPEWPPSMRYLIAFKEIIFRCIVTTSQVTETTLNRLAHIQIPGGRSHIGLITPLRPTVRSVINKNAITML